VTQKSPPQPLADERDDELAQLERWHGELSAEERRALERDVEESRRLAETDKPRG
jgi:anti-sigma-K factor RskA